MNWQQQMQEIVSGWTATQQRLWDNWTETLRTLGYPDQADAWQRQYQQSLESWERAVQDALSQQQSWADAWSDAAGAGVGSDRNGQQWAGQMQELMAVWTESQQQLWDTWLTQIRSAGGDARWSQGLETVVASWEEAARRSQQAMADWGRMTATGSGGSDTEKKG